MGLGKTALILGGIAYAANEVSKGSNTNRSANIQVGAKMSLDTQAVLKAIRENPDLLALVRGEKGDIGNGYKATSTSSTAIATGSKSFDVGTPNLAYSVGARVRITATSDVAKFMEGVVTAYSGNTLTVLVDIVGGTGTLASWNLNVAGEKGATGTAGSNASEIVRYGGSLVKNSALELLTLEGWFNGVLGAVNEGLPTLEITSTGSFIAATNTNVVYLDNRRLYKATLFAKTTGNNSTIYLQRLDKDGTAILHSSDGGIYPLNGLYFNDTTFQKKTFYFGGIGSTLNTHIGLNTVKTKIAVGTGVTGTTTISKLIFEEVSLAEPVPYNLSYLPAGQMVIDPTTSEVGYYNGTAVVWFAA